MKASSFVTAGLAALLLTVTVPLGAQEKKPEAKPEEKKPVEVPLFPDKQLEAAVRQQVFAKRTTTDPIFESDVKNISLIKGNKMGIKDLTGLEKCKTLLSIDLSGNEITNLAPLAGLDRVQQLILNQNKISDLTPLATMKALQYIGIEGNQVKSLEPLKGLDRLSSFYATGNQIEDLSPLHGLPKLHTIQANQNKITKLDGINKLKWLDSLGLRDNQITDLKPLVGLPGLSSFLFLENNKVSDLSPLLEMCRQDLAGGKRFAPYLRIYLKGNPLDSEAAKGQIAEMKKLNLRLADL